MKQGSDGLALVGRVLLGLIFVISGWGKLTGFADTVGFIASKGLAMPEMQAAVAVAIELGGGLALLAGFKARWAALVIAAFTLVITPIFHSFWNASVAEAVEQEINFMKNVSIVGGMLMIMAFGPGKFSIDRG